MNKSVIAVMAVALTGATGASAASVPKASRDGSVDLPAISIEVTVDGKPVDAQVYAEAVWGGTFPADFYGSTTYSQQPVPLAVANESGGRVSLGGTTVPNQQYYGFEGLRLTVNPRGKQFDALPGAERHLKRARTKVVLLRPGEAIPPAIALESNDNMTGTAVVGASPYEWDQVRVAVTSFLAVSVHRWRSQGESSASMIPDAQWDCLRSLAARGAAVSVFGPMEDDKTFLVEDVDDATLGSCGSGIVKKSEIETQGILAGVRALPVSWDGR